MMGVSTEDLELISEQLKQDISFYKNKHIYLTGGTGFFGKWLLETFIFLNKKYSANISVTILTRDPIKFKRNFPRLSSHNKFNFVKGEVQGFELSNKVFDLIIHAAADVSTGLNDSARSLMRTTVMEGTKRICDFAKRVECKRILYVSSGAAYGPQPEKLPRLPETFLQNPDFNFDDAYAATKFESEEYFILNAPCDVIVARCFAFSGPYLPLNGNFAFGNFINDVLNDRDIVINGSGTSIRSYLYAADLIIWLLRILSVGKGGELYNVGSDESISILELAQLIMSESCINKKVIVLGSDLDTESKNIYVPDVSKASNELSISQNITLQSAIIRTINFEKNK